MAAQLEAVVMFDNEVFDPLRTENKSVRTETVVRHYPLSRSLKYHMEFEATKGKVEIASGVLWQPSSTDYYTIKPSEFKLATDET